jgi:hypothetical protein
MPEITIDIWDGNDTVYIVGERTFASIDETVSLGTGGTIDNNTKLLLHMDGSSGSTVFTDSATPSKGNATVVGGAQVDVSPTEPWGTNNGMLLLNGTSDYIYFDDSADWEYGSGDFVLEGWVSSTNTPAFMAIVGQHGANFPNVGATLNVIANRLRMAIGDTAGTGYALNYTAPAGDVADGNLNHTALVRSGENFKLFLNGSQVGSTQIFSGTINPGADAKMTIGVLRHAGPTGFFDGWIDEVRVSKGTDRGWSNGFTPPTRPYGYSTASPSPGDTWTALPVGTIIDMSTIRIPENNNTGDAGSVKYQWAANSGALNGVWLTQTSLQAVSDITVTDATQSIKIVGQYISNSIEKTTTRAFATADATFPTGNGGAYTSKSGFTSPLKEIGGVN